MLIGVSLSRIKRIEACGADLHIFTGNQPYLEYPRVMGHVFKERECIDEKRRVRETRRDSRDAAG